MAQLNMPILTIAIPTYNRSKYLYDTINSIIAQPEFEGSNEVEIVVSDNCSTDDTEKVMAQFLIQHPSKIKYNRNTENILDRNFEKVLSLASGNIIKLNNDTLIFAPGSLGSLLKIVKYCVEKNFIPFFLNVTKAGYRNKVECKNICSFISATSYWCTYIGGFCIPRELFRKMEDFSRESTLQLVQVDVLMRLAKSGNQFLVIPDTFFITAYRGKKGGYDLPKIFLTNYFKILGKYFTNKNEIECLKKEKKKTLFKFILPWIARVRVDSIRNASTFTFDISNYRKIVKNEFNTFIYLFFETCVILNVIIKLLIPEILIGKLKELNAYIKKRKTQKLNKLPA